MVWSGLGMTPKDTAVSIMAKTALTNDKGWNCNEKVKYGRDHEELESLYKSVLPLTRRWTECNHWYSFPFCQTLLLMMIMVRHLDDSVDVEATNEHWHCHFFAAHIPDDFCDPQLSYIPDDQKRRPLVLIGGSMCSSSQSSAPVRPSFKIQSNVLPNILSLVIFKGRGSIV